MTKRLKTRTTRARHSQEFNAEALKLGDTVGVQAAAEQLGLQPSQLYAWRSRARWLKSRGEVDEELSRENARLRRALAQK